jgi:hypothetical protein
VDNGRPTGLRSARFLQSRIYGFARCRVTEIPCNSKQSLTTLAIEITLRKMPENPSDSEVFRRVQIVFWDQKAAGSNPVAPIHLGGRNSLSGGVESGCQRWQRR